MIEVFIYFYTDYSISIYFNERGSVAKVQKFRYGVHSLS